MQFGAIFGFLVGAWIILGFFVYPKICDITSDIKAIRETVTQQSYGASAQGK